MDCHTVREKVQAGMFQLMPISTQEQTADILTRPLRPDPFQKLHNNLGMLNIHFPAWGGVSW